MSAHIVCITSGGGLPIFSRKKGNCENLPFSIIGSLNGVHMFGKPLGIEIINSLTDDYVVAWKEFVDSVVIIGIASGCSVDILNKILESVFNAVVLIVGTEEVKTQRNIERLKRELRVCYPLIDRLLDSLDCGDSTNKHSSDLAGFVETILCPENHLIQIVLDSFTECVDSMFSCVLISGKIAAATQSWWSLHPDELKLLSLLATSENTANSKDIPVFLPYKSPTVAFRFVACTLIPEVQLCCLCGPTPVLNDVEHSVMQCFKNSTDILNSALHCFPKNFPNNYVIDGNVLGLLLVNTTIGKYMISKSPQQNSAKKSTSSSHRLDILRTFFYRAVLSHLIPIPLSKNRSSGGNATENNSPKDKMGCDESNVGMETYWCSEYHKCHAVKSNENILCVLYSSSVPTHCMRLITQKTLKQLISDKQVSMVICEAEEKRHRSGVNALQLDPALDRLYSAGRDSIIRVYEHERFLHGMEHHTDWVNDIVLCCGGRHLISASSDTTVKVWNAHKGFCMSTLRTHKDYVKALAYAKDREQVASAGLDKSIYLWDINTLTALTASNNTVTTSSLIGSKESIYSLAMNPSGSIIVSGSTEKALRLWDPRTCAKLFKLKGHADNVKALVVSRDGTMCLSGSSDGSIKLWNLGSQRNIQTIRVHTDSVWALLATESFSHVISGGRDKKVIMTDLKNISNSIVVCVEEAPVLKMCFTADQQAVWVSTSDSSIRCWKLPTEKHFKDEAKMPSSPVSLIPGGAAIRQAVVLNDKRHILTKDAQESVAVYDVLRAKKVEDLGQVNFQDELKRRFKMVYVPNWFNVDLKTGMLTIHLGQDEVDCFSAWVSARDAGIKDTPEPDHKVNYGKLLLQALFEHWRGVETDPENRLYFSVPKHIPLILSEVGGRTLYRVLVGDTSGDTENALLNETVPNWVISNIEENCTNKFIKVQFYLQPHSSVPSHLLKQDRMKKPDRLVANDFIQCRKVAEHILEKLLGDGSASSPGGGDADSTPSNNGYNVDQIELTCNDQVLEPSMDLRTVKHFIWKSSSDLTLYYKIINK